MTGATAIDLFAGAGGFTAGAEAAGVHVLWAANHWPDAVEVHARNHPRTEHSCQDLQQADWSAVPDHDLLLASPACQGHSFAGQPGRRRRGVIAKQQADRNTAWAVVSCAEVKRPRTILVENVAAFLRWPLLPAWMHALELLGYELRTQVFDVADFGVPQNRKRAIVSARLGEPLELASPGLAHRPFGPSIDWNAGDWKPLRENTPGVRRRVYAARRRIGEGRFLTHYVTGHRGRELSRPIGCVTTKAQWAVVRGDHSRMLTPVELRRAMGFDDDYYLPPGSTLATRLLGNAMPPGFARDLIQQAEVAA